MQIRPYIRQVRLKTERIKNPDRYPFSIPAVRDLNPLSFHEKVTFLVGENGAGKSTLLEAFAVAFGFCPEGGGWNFRLETRATHSALWEYLEVVKGPLPPRDGYFLRAESFYNVASYLEDLDEIPAAAPPLSAAYGGDLHQCSHGEGFFALLSNRLGGNGLYLFDEPEAALSPTRQMAMLARMHRLVQGGSQLIIATHSPILLAYPDCKICQLDENGIREIDYEQTQPYQLTKGFLQDYRRVTEELLCDA